jgi:hypothetical protein
VEDSIWVEIEVLNTIVPEHTLEEITGGQRQSMLTINSCIKVRLDLQADKSPVVVKGPFFPRVVNPRYRIRGTNV